MIIGTAAWFRRWDYIVLEDMRQEMRNEMNGIPERDHDIDEAYLVKTYCVSRQQARRLIKKFGSEKSEMDLLLGAKGRTRQHRKQDVKRTIAQVSFG